MDYLYVLILLLLCSYVMSFAPIASKIAQNVRKFDLNMKLIVGLNKYSHDASVCIVDAKDGNILFAQAKERITGIKHDGGATGDLLRYGLRTIDASVDDIQLVVSNNHHFRIGPFENRIDFYRTLDYVPLDYDDPLNLLPNVEHIELSHHLAHAWSVATTAPFREGLILVMDGMGEQYKAMAEDMGGLEKPMVYYMHDLKLLKEKGGDNFVGVPTALRPGSTYREAETAYIFDNTGLTPLYKRWSRERSPSELYNHGFENMESMGAVYSRISSHLLGDWNACGKVMGLAPWAGRQKNDASSWIFNQKLDNLNLGEDFHHSSSFMTGNPFIDADTNDDNSNDGFKINWNAIDNLKNSNDFSIGRFDELASIARSVQDNLETSATSLVTSLQDVSGAKNLALVGGVALNSVLNGKLVRESNFDNIFVPPAPGDEGIAVGCAMYGLQQIREREDKQAPLVSTHMPVYQGRSFNDDVVDDIVFESIPWAIADQFESLEEATEAAAKSISEGKVIGWFQGRSEFGQRSLGSRSFLADPRDANMRSYINQHVKVREWWRPLAPSILASEAGNWFEGLENDEEGGGQSPYMSITSYLKIDKSNQVPSVAHVDGSARLQTVGEKDSPLYYKLIRAFFKLTGVPMILNTSLNRKGPIVESPEQAIQTMLACNGHCSELYIGKWRVKPRPFPLEDSKTMMQAYATPKEEEKAISVYGVRFYISEVTAGPSVELEPLRIRVQDGKSNTGVGGQDEWKILPTNLHLEVLQLLQPQDEAAYDISNGAGYTATEEELPDVSVEDLWEAMKEIREYNITWSQIVDVLKWLFQNQLCYFKDPKDATGTGEIDPAILFQNVRITDLRE